MLDTLRQVPLFTNLTDEQLQWVTEHTSPVALQADEQLFTEGNPANYFYVVLDGEIQITKRARGVDTILATHHAGAFSGEVPLLTNSPYIASARALRASNLLRMKAQDFHSMLVTCPPVVGLILSTMAKRVQTTEMLMQQREKLVALGTMAAGLAHELNNPAAAAHRAAGYLQEMWQNMQTLTQKLNAHHLSPVQRNYLATFQQTIAEQAAHTTQLDTLEQSDREELLTDWLDQRDITDGWKLAPIFVQAGLQIEQIEDCSDHFPQEALADVLAYLSATLEIHSLAGEVEEGTRRISTLVKAVKDYTYMDQAPLQEIDIHDGLESTLVILQHKLKGGITVIREYNRSLPRISAYGSELNQVWTNLLDNAIDALNGHGQITIRTWRENDCQVVEIADNGPGIPPEVLPRIFEPFFTTKGVGKGTGLGLDISYRIAGHHHGDITVTSSPGDTRFQVHLPMLQHA